MDLLKPSHWHVGGAVLLALGLAAWTASCTTLDDLTAPSCAFALSSTSAAFDTQGGTGTVAVHTASACRWTVTTNDAWVVFTTPTSGSGDGSIAFAVAATNAGAPARSATLSVAGQSFTVSQSGTATSCTFAASPVAATYPPASGSGKITVTTAGGCTWTAASQANWITITSGRNGTGNGTVNYTVAENKSKNSRSGTVIAAGRTVTISQGAALK